jgi:uncharacterized protein (TIGR02145 family)
MIKNMKKGLFFLLGMFMGYMNMAQVPNSFSYQMVIRNGNNELVANTTIGIRIGLLGGNAADTVWYEEEHKVKTNLNGLAYITIGKGNMLKGAVSTIDWTRGPFFIKSETDPTGGTNYSLIIVSQMLSVPYAIYAKTAEKLSTPVTESDPLFNKSVAKGITAEDTARWSRRETLDGNVGGGGGITNESDPVFSNSVAKGIRSVDTAAWNNKLNLRDTLNMLRTYLRASDTASLSNRLNQKVDLQQLNTNTLTLDGKINIADTAGMLANYRTGINAKVNIADTLNMLTPYLRDTDTTAMLANYRLGINTKVNIADTAKMLLPYLRGADTSSILANYRTGINAKVNILDTLNMLIPYLRDADTTAMLANYRTGINAKVNILDTASMLQPYLRSADTTSMLLPYLRDADTILLDLENRFTSKVNITDTAAMLANYRTGINAKVNILDTASMLQPYLRSADTTSMLLPYLRDADTTAMLANYFTGINAKVNILDTASMLQPYLRDADTTSMLSPYLRDADTTAMLNNYRMGINAKVNILDTASMLQPYLRDADTTSMLSPYLRRADTTLMLTPYLRDADTTSMLSSYLRRADTTLMLIPYLRDADTTSMLLPYLRDVDTTMMLEPYLRDADTTMMLEPYMREPESPVNGDILFYNNNKWIRLPIGQEGQFLTVNTGIPTWVSVSTVPGPPTAVSATSGNSSASVAFVAPASNGGTIITVYRVTSNPGGITATGTASPINITGLTNGLSYTFTVVATNAVGNSFLSAASTEVIPSFSCGTSTVSDIDGNTYNTVSISTQCWMRDNLKSSRYRNGYPMPYVWGNSDWLALTTGAWCNYNNNSSSNDIYGKLYNWYAVVNAGGICPTGWHVPTDAEWTTLTSFLGGPSDAGGKMKTIGTTYWSTPNTSADNSSGFSGLGGGYRSSTDAGGAFYDFGNVAVFWSDSVYDPSRAYSRFLRYNDSRFDWGILSKSYGGFVRCLKD